MALEALPDEEWHRVREGDEEIGYFWVTPSPWLVSPAVSSATAMATEPASPAVFLDTGSLRPEMINLLLTHLPIEISFVDENDTVAYCSATKERLFPRSPGVIGRKVQDCHPQKSLRMVQRIIEEFRAGRRHVAEFTANPHGKYVHIRYFAVRDKAGVYRGTLEVTQDITLIRKLEGEKRLLDWE